MILKGHYILKHKRHRICIRFNLYVIRRSLFKIQKVQSFTLNLVLSFAGSVIDEHVKYVYIEKTSTAVFVVLTLLAISLIVALVVIGILWRKLRSRVYAKRVPVQIVRKCEDDEYSVMMDWT